MFVIVCVKKVLLNYHPNISSIIHSFISFSHLILPAFPTDISLNQNTRKARRFHILSEGKPNSCVTSMNRHCIEIPVSMVSIKCGITLKHVIYSDSECVNSDVQNVI